MIYDSFFSTGNEYISLDHINKKDASINNFTLLHMNSKGLLDFRGEKKPLLEILIKSNDKIIEINNIKWDIINFWIPKGLIETDEEIIELTILTPLKQKGFVYNISIYNKTDKNKEYEISFRGELSSVYHCVNEEKEFDGKYDVKYSEWNKGPVFSISNGLPILSYAPIIDIASSWEYNNELPIGYNSDSKIIIEPINNKSISCFIGVGFEEVSSITSAIHMNRLGFNFLYEEMIEYLNQLLVKTKDNKFNKVLNKNLIYTLFFSTGLTIDTEERVIVTSRSPKYYVSAAYWDRDSLLWAFPAIVKADKEVAREIIEYIVTVQSKNIGIHSRFIDGTVLEPGFELDELCSFIIALEIYIDETKDLTVIQDYNVIKLIQKILNILETKKSKYLGLYETFLQPTDDMRVYPYLTYNNVLVYKCFKILDKIKFKEKDYDFNIMSKELYYSIYKHCVKTVNGVKQFVWSVDDSANFDIYDEPPGSLILLPIFDFVSVDDVIYQNTVNVIKDESYEYSFSNKPFGAIGCPHAPHPWVLSLANNLRVFHDKDSLNKLLKAKMDNGIACESIDEVTGECTTGEAFATCAGYLAYSLILETDRLN
ncbi:MAG: glycoside hydrolase family 125 protein [Pleomorphochaeta sp.]